jgi:hypothetical protein
MGGYVVTAVADANNFTATQLGKATLTTGQWDAVIDGGSGGGLIPGEHYWLSSTAGKITSTKPTSGLIQRILHAESATVASIGVGEVISLTDLASMIPNAFYRTLLQVSGSHIAGQVAGTYLLGQGDPAAISGTGTLYPIALIYIDPSEFLNAGSLAAKLRLRVVLCVNDVAPTGSFTFGLYPITRPSTSGAAGVNAYTAGTVVSGSQPAAIATPAADSANSVAGADFSIPSAGLYAIGVLTTATVAASSHLHFNAQLQMRHA